MRVALYQPDIPQNTGTILRLCACLCEPVDIIHPAGFNLSDRALRRASLDYNGQVPPRQHETFAEFKRFSLENGKRLVLLTTRAETAYFDFSFNEADTLILGRESAGVPDSVHNAVDFHIRVPMAAGFRSLNVAVALAMVLGEALKQTGGFSRFA